MAWTKEYKIDGKTFLDKLDVQDGFEEFKLYAEKIGPNKDKENEPPAKTYQFEVQPAEHGYIINSSLYLGIKQYNAMTRLLDNCLQCYLCNHLLMEDECEVHVASERHQGNLKRSPVVDEYRSDMFRLVMDNYHCGICNEFFDKCQASSHLQSSTHLDNKIFASQKAAEIMIKINVSVINKNIYGANKKTKNKNNDMENNNNDMKNKNNEKDLNDKTNSVKNLAVNEIVYIKPSNENTKHNHTNKYIDMGNKINDMENEKNDMKNKNNEKDLIVKTNIVKDSAVDGVVSIKSGKKVFYVPYYTWQMITISQSKEYFYCMACISKNAKDYLEKHIEDFLHENNLRKFKINEAYEDHLIRQDRKWAHCSSCNNINYINDTDIHMMKHAILSSKKQDNENKNNENKHNDDTNRNNDASNKTYDGRNGNNDAPNKTCDGKNENNDVQIKSSDARIPNNDANTYSRYDRHVNNANSLVNATCFGYLFGFKLKISVLSLHVIVPYKAHFYCGLCRMKIHKQYVQTHINSITHTVLLSSTPAIKLYGSHYIRKVYNLFHCGMCNIFIQPRMLLSHLQDTNHRMRTKVAFGIGDLPPLMPQIARVMPYVKKYEPIQNKDYHANDNTNEIVNKKSETEERVDGIKNVNNNSKMPIDIVRNQKNKTSIVDNKVINTAKYTCDTKNKIRGPIETINEIAKFMIDTKNEIIGTKNTIGETSNNFIDINKKSKTKIKDTNKAIVTCKNTSREMIKADQYTDLKEASDNLTVDMKKRSNAMKNIINDNEITGRVVDTTNNINLPIDSVIRNNEKKDTTYKMENKIHNALKAINRIENTSVNVESKDNINETIDTASKSDKAGSIDMKIKKPERNRMIFKTRISVSEAMKRLDEYRESIRIENSKNTGDECKDKTAKSENV